MPAVSLGIELGVSGTLVDDCGPVVDLRGVLRDPGQFLGALAVLLVQPLEVGRDVIAHSRLLPRLRLLTRRAAGTVRPGRVRGRCSQQASWVCAGVEPLPQRLDRTG